MATKYDPTTMSFEDYVATLEAEKNAMIKLSQEISADAEAAAKKATAATDEALNTAQAILNARKRAAEKVLLETNLDLGIVSVSVPATNIVDPVVEDFRIQETKKLLASFDPTSPDVSSMALDLLEKIFEVING